MPTFKYRAIDRTGKEIRGQIDAGAEELVVEAALDGVLPNPGGAGQEVSEPTRLWRNSGVSATS